MLRITKAYNAYMGTQVDHVRMQEIVDRMGPLEWADLWAILQFDRPAVPAEVNEGQADG